MAYYLPSSSVLDICSPQIKVPSCYILTSYPLKLGKIHDDLIGLNSIKYGYGAHATAKRRILAC